MRVAHVLLGRCNPDSANGVDKTVYYLAKYQAALGAKVMIFSLTLKEPIPVPGAEVNTFPPPKSKWARLWPRSPRGLLEALLAWVPDVVHFHSVHIGTFVGLGSLLKREGVPYVVTPNGGFAPGRLARVGPEVRAYVRLLEKPYLEGARFVHAVSHNDVEGLRSLGVRARVVVVPNGIDPAAVPARVDSDLLRRRFPVLQGKRVFLFLGRLDPVHKGLDLLLEAFAAARLPAAALVLVGPDWRGSLARLWEQARRLGLEERVVFAGPAFGEEKWAYLAGADVFVHPSRWEGFSFSVLEAMTMGKPVLLSKPADPGEVSAYGAGVTVDPKVPQLVEGIRELGEAPTKRLNEMGLRARALVEGQFDWQGIALRLISEYER